jgi:predicted  nucleic acid-binding Zn-ribbon protein
MLCSSTKQPRRACKRPMMNSELAAELADAAQLKTAIRELCKLRKESGPLNRAWSDTRIARQRYEREYAFAVKQLQEREDHIMDELWPYLAKIEALEKEVRKLDRKIRKAQSGSKS